VGGRNQRDRWPVGLGMKAIIAAAFGGPDVLELTDLPDPIVGPDEVLISVRASSVNPVDWKIREGYLQGALVHHLPIILGWDVAGVVQQAGPGASQFSAGDEVFGYVRKDVVEHGTYAGLVSAGLRHIAPRPATATFEQAAALPLAGLTALQSLDVVEVDDGDVVLVHAAAGGVGHLAVQLAVARGARVIGTASEVNHDFLRSLGAEPVVYGAGLVDRVRAMAPGGVDAVLDLVGGDALATSPEVVKRSERIVSIVDGATAAGFGGRYVFVRPDPAGLSRLATLVDAGALRVQIARTFPLAEAAAAQQLVQAGHVRGKVVISVA
jgi:NADPH:quinone reductase-like Zn-dependent oxidoreductase